ncbi:MAG: hypothetical protein AAB074_17965 [Planctomycetota bacterium]
MPKIALKEGDTDETRSEPNFRLYPNWENVFRKIPGFENCVCLRRVRTPNSKDPDFTLFTVKPEPRIGLVECEGHKGPHDRDKSIAPIGVEQLLTYLAGWESVAGRGQLILDTMIKDAFLTQKRKARYQRGEHNQGQWGRFEAWLSKIGAPVTSESELVAALSASSMNLTAILLYYRRSSIPSEDERMVSSAFRRHRCFFGAVSWPDADRLLEGGKYVD